MAEYFEIRIKGHLDPHWSDWFSGMALTTLQGGETLLRGTLPDQAALYGLLERMRNLNLTLLSVSSGEQPADGDANKEDRHADGD